MDQLPSTTSAALLGQLAWRPQTPYELARAMSRNVRFFWPRADSHVYREVKRLVAEGWARAEPGRTGRRSRTVYHVTPSGREALAAWHAAPPGGTALEHEPVLRVFLGGTGTRADLLAALGRARADADAMLAIGRPLADEYLEGRHEFSDQVHVRALSFDYLYGWAQFTSEWAQRAETEVRRWRDVAPSPAKRERALDRLRAIVGA